MKKKRPFTLIKTAMSLDGYIDDTLSERLILSNPADFAAGERLRTDYDAIMIGARSIRRDNPRLTVRDPDLLKLRLSRGQEAQPVKVTVTNSGELSPGAHFFQDGPADKLVYCSAHAEAKLRASLADCATLVAFGETQVDLKEVAEDLHRRGITRLLVEGGGIINQHLLNAALVDAMRISIAPFFVGAQGAARVVAPGTLTQDPANPMSLTHVEQLGDVAVLNYQIKR